MLCFLGLGSNLATPKRQLILAVQHLRHIPRTVILKQSSLYISEAWGVRYQPNYYNLVIKLYTKLTPMQLLHYCQLIEQKQHRVRKQRFAARTLDIDILLYGNLTINTPTLILPHPRMWQREFVMQPLAEIQKS